MTTSPQRPTPDRELARRVRAAIRSSADLDAGGIRVTVADGAVRLRGQVRCYAGRLRARQLALGVAGVTRVDDELQVHPIATGWRRADSAIEHSVRQALVRELGPNPAVDATVAQHVVTLFGRLPDAETRRRVRHCVEVVRGVHFVHNRITVPQEAA